jgi:acetolactate synthase I/II/III large subunit
LRATNGAPLSPTRRLPATLTGLQKAYFCMTHDTTFPNTGSDRRPDYGAIAKGCGLGGIRIHSAAEFKPVLEKAIASGKPCLIDVAMRNNPTPTAGH